MKSIFSIFKKINRIDLLLVFLLISTTTHSLAQIVHYPLYGQVNASVGANPIDLASGDTLLDQVDYQSPLPGFSFARYNRLGNPHWSVDFLSSVKWTYWVSVDNQIFESLDVYYPDRRIYFNVRDPNYSYNLSQGQYEKWQKVDASTYMISDPKDDTKTYFKLYSSVDVGSLVKSYVINSRVLRDGSSIHYDWDTPFNENSCQSLWVRHAPSGKRYRINRSVLTYSIWNDCRITSIILPDSSVIKYNWTVFDNPEFGAHPAIEWILTSVTYPGGGVKKYTYDRMEYKRNYFVRRVVGISDEENRSIATYGYSATGAPTLSYSGLSTSPHQKVSVAYNTDGSRTVTDGDGIARVFKMSANGLSGVSALCGWCQAPFSSILYDTSNGLVSQTTDFRGSITKYTRYPTDPRRREHTRVEGFGQPEARTTTTVWHPTFNLPTSVTVSSSAGSYTNSYSYNGYGQETSHTFTGAVYDDIAKINKAVSRTTTTTYVYYAGTSTIQTKTVNGPRTDVVDQTIYTYNTLGQLAWVRDALSRTTYYGNYDAHGRAQLITHPNGTTTVNDYDWRGNLLSTVTAGVGQYNTYYKNGKLWTSSTPGDATEKLTYLYDDAGRNTQIIDNLNNKTVYTYDGMGRKTRTYTVNPAGGVNYSESKTFTNAGRTIASSGTYIAGTTTTETLDAGYLSTYITNPSGRTSRTLYDALGRVESVLYPTTAYQLLYYDAGSSPYLSRYLPSATAVTTDPQRQDFVYRRDAQGKLHHLSDADTGYDTFTLDLEGNTNASTNTYAGPNWKHTFDATNRPLRSSVVNAAGAELSYIQRYYDVNPPIGTTTTWPWKAPTGKLARVISTHGTKHLVYNDQGRVAYKAESRWAGGGLYVDAYGYDTPGRVTYRRYPSGRETTYTLNNLGQATSIQTRTNSADTTWTTLADSIAYYPFGAPNTWRYAATYNAFQLRDTLGRITDYSDGDGGIKVTWLGEGKVDTLLRRTDSTLLANYDYNPATRHLTVATNGGVTRNYAHDVYGNLASGPSGTFTPNANTSRLANRTYGARGVVKIDPYNTMGYDERNLMQSVTNTGGTTTYKYDADGRRQSKTSNGNTVYYHYDLAGNLIAENDSTGWLKEYIWHGNKPIAVIIPAKGTTPEAIYYIHTDQANTPVALTTAAGTPVWRWKRGAYGEGAPTTTLAGFEFNLRMPGQYYDKESGYHYNMARYFDPRSGRYLQPDPSGESGGGVGAYAYTHGDPVNSIDPMGAAPVNLVRALSGATVGAISAQRSGEGDPTATLSGTASGFLLGYFSPFGASPLGQVATAASANIGAQIMASNSLDIDFNQTAWATMANVGARWAFSALKMPEFAILTQRGLLTGEAQVQYKYMRGQAEATRQALNDSYDQARRMQQINPRAGGLSQAQYFEVLQYTPFNSLLNSSNFWAGNPANISGWPSGGFSYSWSSWDSFTLSGGWYDSSLSNAISNAITPSFQSGSY